MEDERLRLLAALHLQYALRDVRNYYDLTRAEQEIFTLEEFNKLKCGW